MGYVEGEDRDQAVLFPELIDEYVEEDNPVRFIEAFVGSLDLAELGFNRATPADLGRPGYHPGDMLRMYLYGYLNGIRSSRKLEKESGRNLELMWLMRKLKPDFKTIANFRKDNLEAIKKVFREFTVLCKQMGLFGGELIGIDGTKIKAVNSKQRNFTVEKLAKLISGIDEKIDEYVRGLDETDEHEGEATELSKEELKRRIEELSKRKEKYKQIDQQMTKSGENQLSQTDPDSRLMKVKDGKDVCYNVQIAVDNKHKLIVEQEVTNVCDDHNELAKMACGAKEVLGVQQVEVVADKGYYGSSEVKKCEEAGITVYMARRKAGRQGGVYSKDEFTYKSDEDVYVCPAGEKLAYRGKGIEKGRGIKYYVASTCSDCALKKQCTTSAFRRIKRLEDEEVLERMAVRVRGHPEKLRLRSGLVEHPFGTMKRWMNQGYFLMRTKKKVAAEFSLTALAYNIKRVINQVGVLKMIEAIE
jgi:transposase